MDDLLQRARAWIAADPDPSTRAELEEVIASGDLDELRARMDTVLEFGTAGIRGRVGAGPGRMNRAVVIRTTHGLATYLKETAAGGEVGRVAVGFDARPDSRTFAEDTAGAARTMADRTMGPSARMGHLSAMRGPIGRGAGHGDH